MSHAEKSTYYRELKAAGVKFDKTYQQYTTEELKAAWQLLRASQPAQPELVAPSMTEQEFARLDRQLPPLELPDTRAPDQEAGLRQNTPDAIRVDENGLIWYQDEVRKPPYPKPRGRRVLRYVDPGVETQTVVAGGYLESFEVAGTGKREAEVKITLPSYQVGIYKDPRYPFRIHVYNENRGFDLFEVQAFYGGAELVPQEIKRVYISNSLCYDIRTTVRAIETEYRQQQLTGTRGNRP